MLHLIPSPTNVDYLVPSVRIYVADSDNERYSDTLVRTAILSAVRQLQHRWQNRYLVFVNEMEIDQQTRWDLGVYYQAEYDAFTASGIFITPEYLLPSGYIYISTPEGYGSIRSVPENHVFRNPNISFMEKSSTVVVQSDEFPIVLTAAIILRRSQLTSSADSFISWSDGEFSVSGIQSGKILASLLTDDQKALEDYFRRKLASPIIAEI